MYLITTVACLQWSKARYNSAKVTGVGLKSNPYTIPDEQWVTEPSEVPNVAWSDMFVYMIAMPSAYTREEVKVSFKKLVSSTSGLLRWIALFVTELEGDA